MKKFLILFLFSLFCSATVSAQNGEIGLLSWEITDGALIISGDGEIPDFSMYSLPPWKSWREIITSIDIRDGVIGIGVSAFDELTKAISVSIPSSVTTIRASAFGSCILLTSITIPASVTFIDNTSFLYSSIAHIWVDEANPYYSSIDGVLFNRDETTLIVFPPGRTGIYTIPEPVAIISGYAFAFCTQLTSVIIPQSVSTINNHAFYRSGITSIALSAYVSKIEENAFSGCALMTSISVDEANQIFSSKDGVLFNKNMTTLVAFPSGITGDYTIPESVHTIGTSAFWECKLSAVTIPHSVTAIQSFAFRLSGHMRSITIPSSVTSIGFFAFLDCYGLNSVVLPASVTNISEGVFFGCNNLTEIINTNPTPQMLMQSINYSIFSGTIYNSCILRVPAGSVDNYKNTELWNEFIYIEAIETEITLDKKEIYLLAGASDKLAGTVTGSVNYPEVILWTSSRMDVATVDVSGKVIAGSQGTTVISAFIGSEEATCSATVIEPGKSSVSEAINNSETENMRINLYIKPLEKIIIYL